MKKLNTKKKKKFKYFNYLLNLILWYDFYINFFIIIIYFQKNFLYVLILKVNVILAVRHWQVKAIVF